MACGVFVSFANVGARDCIELELELLSSRQRASSHTQPPLG